MSEREIDLTRPFIAIREDVDGDDYTPTMGEYLCNPLDEDLLDVEISTGGYFSDSELGVIQADGSRKEKLTIPAGGCVRFALSTWDEYREFVIHWSVRYRTNTLPVTVRTFGTFKNLADVTWLKDVPCLGTPGCVAPI